MWAGLIATAGLAVAAVALPACGGTGTTSNSARTTERPRPSGGVGSQQVSFLPNGLRTIAAGRLPNGQGFAVTTQHYRFGGRTYLDLGANLAGGGSTSFHPGQAPGPLAFSGIIACMRKPVMLLVFGLLRSGNDTVVLRSGHTSAPMKRASIPADLHAGGALVYGFAKSNATLTVLSPRHTVVESETLPSLVPRLCAGATVTFLIATRRK